MKRTAVVTGVSRGIGLEVARTLAAAGNRVIGLARTKPKESVGDEFISVDLQNKKQVDEVFADINKRHQVDILVNNAALSLMSKIEDGTFEFLADHVDVNMRALMQCTMAVIPGMKERKYGRIVNVSSRSALGKVGLTIYGATKAAVIGFTRGWALELATTGITVNSVAPGPIETAMFAHNFPLGTPGRQMIQNEVAMRRFGKPEEVAAAIAYFASPQAGFTTGQVLYVCGGATIGLTPM
jgi:NAD(P)-dependent dehydrogenase (short-subunit alcohol dehydrogenase family)